MKTVTVPRDLHARLIEYAEPWPREVGGFLEIAAGTARKVTVFRAAANAALPGLDETLYLPHPAELMMVAARSGLRFGVFHSHPRGDARPSRGDRESFLGRLPVNAIFGRATGELAFYGPGWEPLRVRLIG